MNTGETNIEWYHGSTWNFDKFRRCKLNLANYIPNCLFMSSCVEDVNRHYLSYGQDLINKIHETCDYENKTFEEAAKKVKGKHEIVYSCRFNSGRILDIDSNLELYTLIGRTNKLWRLLDDYKLANNLHDTITFSEIRRNVVCRYDYGYKDKTQFNIFEKLFSLLGIDAVVMLS